ncbi:protein of unknown function [Latilactobacillus sakei]|nr:protein of unknown function [Latilactobacillus sakei]
MEDLHTTITKQANLEQAQLVTATGSYVKNPDIKVRTNLTFNLNYLI